MEVWDSILGTLTEGCTQHSQVIFSEIDEVYSELCKRIREKHFCSEFQRLFDHYEVRLKLSADCNSFLHVASQKRDFECIHILSEYYKNINNFPEFISMVTRRNTDEELPLHKVLEGILQNLLVQIRHLFSDQFQDAFAKLVEKKRKK